MKKTKVIIPALGILLLSTAASVTGTVAWFSMNNTVTASTMTVKAKVTGNLNIEKGLIADKDLINKTDITDLDVSVTTLSPVHFDASNLSTSGKVDAQVPNWDATGAVKPTANTPGTPGTGADAYNSVGFAGITNGADGETSYFAFAQVSIVNKQEPPASYKLTPKCVITLGDAGDTLADALDAAILYKEAGKEDKTAVWHKASGAVIASDKVTCSFADLTLTDNVVYQCSLVIWYEGNDAHCTVNDALTNVAASTAVWSFDSAAISA